MAVLDAQEALLATWNRWVEATIAGEPWVDSRNRDLGRNSIMDAESLECLLLPQFYLERFDLGAPADTDASVAGVLNKLDPNARVIERRLAPGTMTAIIDRLEDFLSRHVSGERASFSPGGYLERPDGQSAGEPEPWVVDSFTMSVSLCLHAMYLVTQWAGDPSFRKTLPTESERLMRLRNDLSGRLTGAMLGLCRSFAVSVEDRETWEAHTQRTWPGGASARLLRDIGRRLGNFFPETPDLDRKVFECGWSWGPTPPDFFEDQYRTVDSWPAQDFYCEPAPYLYFTIGAIDGIGDLFSRKIVAAHLLDTTQSWLASRLGFYRECASSYWSALAFSETSKGAWAVEDPPWRTADGSASDYWTLYLLTIALASDQARENFGGEQKLSRLLSLLEELAQRGRVTRRLYPPDSDPAERLHVPPGEQLTLRTVRSNGMPDGPDYRWSIYDYAPRLLKLVGQVLAIATDRGVRDRASRLIEDIWNQHLALRRVAPEVDSYAWDDVRFVFQPPDVGAGDTETPESKVGSWYITERVVEALVAVVSAQRRRKTGGRLTREIVTEMLDDLRWLLATEFPEEIDLIQRVAAATDMAEESPMLALGVAVEVSQLAEQKREQKQSAERPAVDRSDP